jgi:tetratricopeptide (TPR) repeat protein
MEFIPGKGLDELVRAEDGIPTWGNAYDLARSDLLGLQDQLARAVADALQVQMTTAERERLFRRYTENAAAYERYLEGRALLARSTAESVRASIDAFEEALKIEPNYAPAHPGVALASGTMRIRFSTPADAPVWSERAEREAKVALSLDPQLAEAHEALAGVYRAIEFQWEQTLEEARLALELNPNLDQPHLYRAAAFYHLGLLDQVEPELAAAAEVNPLSQPVRLDSHRARGITALFASRFQASRHELEEVQKQAPGTAGNWLLGQALYYSGDVARAEALMHLSGAAPGDRRSQAVLASVLAARNADAEAKSLVQAVLGGGFMDHHIAYSLGAAFAQLGDMAEARRLLEEAARTGFPCYPWFAKDPLLDPIRTDPQFKDFMSGLESSWKKLSARV